MSYYIKEAFLYPVLFQNNMLTPVQEKHQLLKNNKEKKKKMVGCCKILTSSDHVEPKLLKTKAVNARKFSGAPSVFFKFWISEKNELLIPVKGYKC